MRNKLSSFKEIKMGGMVSPFLNSFNREGRFSVELGIWSPYTYWDPDKKDYETENEDAVNFVVLNGRVLDPSTAFEGIIDLIKQTQQHLPEFDGEELTVYALKDGRWVDAKDIEEKNFLYVSFYSLE